MYILMRGAEVSRLIEALPEAIGGYDVMPLPDGMDPPTPGQIWDGEAFVDPPAPEPEPEPAGPQFRTTVSRAEYYGLFRPDEEAMIRLTAAEPITLAAINAASGADKLRLMRVASLAVMLGRTDALDGAARIDLANAQVQAGLDLLVALGLINNTRKTEILRGVPL
jgi:hypothetical protein